MTKEELRKYARDNRKQLESQEVKLGDVVKVLVGRFAGEKGVVVDIIACGNDYADPYYEVNMDCEVPDKYKCRKNSLMPNVVGGLSACDFEVIGYHTPEPPTYEISPSDVVRLKSDTPREYYANISRYYETMPFEVGTISKKSGGEWIADITACDRDVSLYIPVRFLEPYYSAEDVRRMEEDLQREKEQHLREHSGNENEPKDNTITIPVKADFSEDVGFALLDRALELQKKYTELEGEIKRLYDMVHTAMLGQHVITAEFKNRFLSGIANSIYSGFRPLTADERLQRDAEFKDFIDKALKKQSE